MNVCWIVNGYRLIKCYAGNCTAVTIALEIWSYRCNRTN